MKLLRIGYWRTPAHPTWPEPASLGDDSWDTSERAAMAAYLDDGMIAKSWMGRSRCQICGTLLGSSDLTDGTFIWPEGLSHYLVAHAVRLPQAFVKHATSKLDEFENATLDDAWWIEDAASREG